MRVSPCLVVLMSGDVLFVRWQFWACLEISTRQNGQRCLFNGRSLCGLCGSQTDGERLERQGRWNLSSDKFNIFCPFPHRNKFVTRSDQAFKNVISLVLQIFLCLEALNVTQLLIGCTIRFSQSEVVLHSNLQNIDEKDKECFWECLVYMDPDCSTYSFVLPFIRAMISFSSCFVVCRKKNARLSVCRSISLRLISFLTLSLLRIHPSIHPSEATVLNDYTRKYWCLT